MRANMRKLRIVILALMVVLVFSGCSCKHEWAAADCVNPPTCGKCGATEGEPLGHEWTDATCTTARTCSRCGRSEGEPLGHTWADATCTEPKTCATCGEVLGEITEHVWVEATCTAAKTCSVCGATEGELAEHVWTEATTDTPATCSVCGATEGEKVVTDPRFVTGEVEKLLGRWEATLELSEEDLNIRRFNGSLEGIYWIEFRNDGTAETGIELKDEKKFREAAAECYADWTFEQLEEDEIDEDAANAVAKVLVDTDVEAYILKELEEIPIHDLIEDLLAESDIGDGWFAEYVFYVEDGKLYMDEEWNDSMEETEHELLGTTLLLYGFLECKRA